MAKTVESSPSEESKKGEGGALPAFRSPSPERFEAVVHSISDGVLTVDREWRITCFNRAAEEITGYKRPDVLGRFCYEVLRSDLCRDACPIRRTLETGTPVSGLVVYITDSRDQQVPVSVSTALYRDREGKLRGGVQTFRDLRQIEALKKKVEESYTAGDIVSRNPRVREILNLLPVVSESGSTILIRGLIVPPAAEWLPAGGGVTTSHTESLIPWRTDLERGLAEAKAEGKPVLIDTWATWCVNCRVLDERTFQHPRVVAEADHFIPIKVQLETAGSEITRDFMNRFGLRHYSLPTTLLLNSSGNVVRMLQGVVDPEDMIAAMHEART